MTRHASHSFQEGTERAESRTRIVMALTGAMMAAEIAAGAAFKSMALTADGWHMGTHLSAFLIAALAYSFARRNKDNRRFTFGTGKIGALGGFASSILLVVVAAVMIKESVGRLVNPAAIDYRDALIVAVAGFLVNLASALILKDGEGGGLAHSHGSGHSRGAERARGPEPRLGRDANLKAAYLHVVADAFTSVTAIAALLAGFYFGLGWVDAVMGFVGSFVIVLWAIGIVKETIVVLVDYFPAWNDLEDKIRKAVASAGDARIDDLHVWQVASGKFAAILSIASDRPRSVEEYSELLSAHEELVHVTIQVSADGDGRNA
jgi:cation diffusion facilitator family transporter